MDIYANEQMPGNTKAKNNHILEQKAEKITIISMKPLQLRLMGLSSCSQFILMQRSPFNLHNDCFTSKWIILV